jgi:hypothetical protein
MKVVLYIRLQGLTEVLKDLTEENFQQCLQNGVLFLMEINLKTLL